MKTAFSIIIFLGLSTSVEIDKVKFKYCSTFAVLPYEYEVDIKNKKIIKISQIRGVENKTKKLSNNRYNSLIVILNDFDFDQLDTKTASQIDGSFYTLTLTFSDGQTESFEAWSVQASRNYYAIHDYFKRIFNEKN